MIDFTSVSLGSIKATKYKVWPTREDPQIYKFNSFWLELSQHTSIIERSSYKILDLIGDIGGFYDGFSLIISRLIKPIALIALNSELLTLAFKLLKGKPTDETMTRSQIPKQNGCLSIMICGKRSRYRKMVDRADSMITKQLDLVKFLH